MNADELKRVKEILDRFGEGSSEDRQRKAEELQKFFSQYKLDAMPPEVEKLWREFRWLTKFTWYPGDVTYYPPDHPVTKAVNMRVAAGLPVQGVSDEEILAWAAEQEKKAKKKLA